MPLKVFGGSLLLPLRIDGYTFDKLPYTPGVDERFSTQLKDQLPDFVLENYETFIQFVEAYYEWSEQHGNPRAEGVRLSTYKDVDDTLDLFLEYFRNTYIKDFPYKLADGTNEKTLIKNVGYMYRSKGSKASFDLLFRVLFDTTIEIDYPKDRILKLSASTFDDRQFIRVAPVFSIDEAKSIENSILVQRSPFTRDIVATALIDRVDYVHEGGFDFFSLAVQDISGTFTTENFVDVITSGTTAAAYSVPVLPTLNSLRINSGGTGYELGDEVDVYDLYGNRILNAAINNVGPIGDIRGFEFKQNFGIYRSDQSLGFSFDTFSGTGASLSALGEQVLTDGPDTYKDDTGKISGRSFIQDSFFYQNYSYINRVNKSLEQFADAVRRLVHPSGTLMFAEYINEVSMSGDAGIISDNIARFTPVIGHYLPHTFGTTLDPRGFTYTTAAGSTHYDFYPNGYNGQDGSTSSEFLKFDTDPTHMSPPSGPATAGQAQLGGPTAGGPYGTPHVFPENGITHDPDWVYYHFTRANGRGILQPIPFNFIQGQEEYIPANKSTKSDVLAHIATLSFTDSTSITNGAFGGTGYIGVTVDSNNESAGLIGYFPAGSDRETIVYGRADSTTRPREAGVTHYGGYTSPPETSLSGGFSGGQITQVVGTDSATADYWVVYRHPAHLGLTAVGPTGSRDVVRIPVQPIQTSGENISTIAPNSSGYGFVETTGISLNGTPYVVGEIVTQTKPREPIAIGRVIRFDPSTYGNQGDESGNVGSNPLYNLGIDMLEVEVLNGKFTTGLLSADLTKDGTVDGLDLAILLGNFGLTGQGVEGGDLNEDGIVDGGDLAGLLGSWDQLPKPVVGETSGGSRLVDPSFNNMIYTSVTHDTSWLDIPISVMVNDIDYSNTTN